MDECRFAGFHQSFGHAFAYQRQTTTRGCVSISHARPVGRIRRGFRLGQRSDDTRESTDLGAARARRLDRVHVIKGIRRDQTQLDDRAAPFPGSTQDRVIEQGQCCARARLRRDPGAPRCKSCMAALSNTESPSRTRCSGTGTPLVSAPACTPRRSRGAGTLHQPLRRTSPDSGSRPTSRFGRPDRGSIEAQGRAQSLRGLYPAPIRHPRMHS